MQRRNGAKSLPQLLEPGFEALGQLHPALGPAQQFGGGRLSSAHGPRESLKLPPREELDLGPDDDAVGALPHLGRRSSDFRRSLWSASEKVLQQRPVSNSVRRLPSLSQVDFAATWSVDIPFRSGTSDSGIDGGRRKTAWFSGEKRNSLSSNGGLENAKVKFAGGSGNGPDSSELAREQKKKKMLALGGGKGAKSLTVVQRKRNHAAALAGDRQYVMALLDEGKEPDEQRKAREQATKEYWLEAAFAPVPSPWSLLPPELQARLPPPPPSQLSPRGRPSPQSGEVPEVLLDGAEVEEVMQVCLLFRALVESQKGGDHLQVLTRQDFCRLICAAQGLAPTQGARPMLCQAVGRFDSVAEMVYTKTSEHGVHGVPIPSEDMPDPEGSSLSTLFGWLVNDISRELNAGLAPEKEVSAMPAKKIIKDAEGADGESAQKVHEPARKRFFGVLLPQAKKFAELRAQKVQQQIGLAALSAPVEAPRPEEAPVEEKGELEDIKDEDEENKTKKNEQKDDDEAPETFFCETFAFIKGEALLGQLCEPEVLRCVADMSQTVKILFHSYADVPTATGDGHMSLAALLRFCQDFGMFPKISDYQTVRWLYGLESSDSQAEKVVPRKASAGSEILSLQSVPPSVPPSAPPSRPESKSSSFEKRKSRVRKSMRAPPQPPVDEGFMYQNKWLKRHLAWMAKEPETMDELELRSCYVLTAIDEWMGSRNLQVLDLFSQMGKTETFNAHDLLVAVDFMDFEDPPTKGDTVGLVGLLVQPDRTICSSPSSPCSPSSPNMREEGDVDFATFQMALITARKIKEKRSRATNCFLKDISKMSRAESNAAIFFKDLLTILEERNLTPETLFRMADIDSSGEVPARDLIIQIHAVFRMQACLSAGVSVQNPFEMLGKELDDMITQQELVDLIEETKDARQLREMNRDDKHPLSVGAIAVAPPSMVPAPAAASGVSFFGQRAFAEMLMKLGFLHLNHHATTTQAELSSFHKCLWIFIFLHWKFDCTQREIMQLIQEKQHNSHGRPLSRSASRPLSRSRSRPGSNASSRPGSSAGGRRFPKHMPPMRKLLARFPKLFENSFREMPPLLAADTATAEDTDQDIADRILHACLGECKEFDEEREEARVAASGPNALERMLIAAAVHGSPLG